MERHFTQKLVVNKFVGKLKRVEWVSYIDLEKEREAEIEACFSCDVDFEDLLEVFKARLRTAKRNDNDDDTSMSDNKFFNESYGFEEKTIHNRLIVMDDVSGLAHESKKL